MWGIPTHILKITHSEWGGLFFYDTEEGYEKILHFELIYCIFVLVAVAAGFGSIVQGIERRFPKPQIRVRVAVELHFYLLRYEGIS